MKRFISALVLSLPLVAAQALELQTDESALYFVSIKNDSISEVLTFDELSGSLSAEGDAQISVPLASVNTGIEIRDERVRKYLFKTEEFSKAVYTAKLDMTELTALKAGEQKQISLSGELALNGNVGKLDFDILVTKSSDGSYSATTIAPGFVDVRSFDLIKGVGKLRSLAGLNSIALTVPVTFSVLFK